jgi:aspartate carbamoyltransferase catalytic subunit
MLHSRVALSNIRFAKQMQSLRSKTLIPKHIESLGVTVEPNLQALEWCDVANMLRVQNERMDELFSVN